MAVMKDIAKRAGVSITTVSFVLNGVAKQHKIAEATVKKVLQAAGELGYHDHNTGRSEVWPGGKPQAEKNIAIVVPTASDWDDVRPFMEEAKKQMVMTGELYKMTLIPYQSGEIITRLAQIDWLTCGAAIVIPEDQQDCRQLQEAGNRYPLIVMNYKTDQYFSVSCSVSDPIYKVLELVKAKRYRKVTAIMSDRDYKISDGHFNQIVAECRKAGIEISGANCIITENTLQGGAIAARKVLQLEERPELILCMNTTLAYGMISLLARNQVYIPRHIEFLCIGWEDELNYIENYIPSLSMIAIPVMEMSRMALQAASSLIENPQVKKTHANCVGKLILNESFSI